MSHVLKEIPAKSLFILINKNPQALPLIDLVLEMMQYALDAHNRYTLILHTTLSYSMMIIIKIIFSLLLEIIIAFFYC
jgi:hypothetical protein